MKIVLKNRLHVLLRLRGIRSAAEFARRMGAEQGYALSLSHATRYARADAPPIDLKFVSAACNLLQCLPSDLYEIRIQLDPGEELDPSMAVPEHATVTNPRVGGGTKAASSKSVHEVQTKSAEARAERKASDAGPSPSIFPFRKPR